jgi:hypothetical protein
MREKIVSFGRDGRLHGILASPETQEHRMVAVLLNAGFTHKVGPNQLYVTLAKALAMAGMPSLRFDFSGIGDSFPANTEASYDERIMQEIGDALTLLTAELRYEKIILVGFCDSASYSFHAGVSHVDVVGVCAINGSLVSNTLLKSFNFKQRIQYRYYRKNLFSPVRWKKVMTGQSGFSTKKIFKRMVGGAFSKVMGFTRKKQVVAPKNSVGGANAVIAPWHKMLERKVRILQVYSEGSDTLDIYNRFLALPLKDLRLSPYMSISVIQDVDHVFTPVWSQVLLITLIRTWVTENFFLAK